MLDVTMAATSQIVAHGHHQPDNLAELILKLGYVLINDPSNSQVKQLALISLLEESVKTLPHDFQANTLLAIVEILLVGPRLLLSVSTQSDFDA